VLVEHPVADGGEGTVDLAVRSGFAPVVRRILGPLGAPVSATYALRHREAVIELASAAGLALLPGPPDDHTAACGSTYGVGVLVADALDRGAERIVLGVGGSASTDGGAGLLVALGARVLDRQGRPVAAGGAALLTAASLDVSRLDPRLRDTDLVIACDVDNPLVGPRGAARVFGPQKGATATTVGTLERALTHWSDLVGVEAGVDVASVPGAGAAGGTAYAALALLGARLESGVDLLLDLSGFPRVVAGAALVVVGEGSLDAQTLGGKGPAGVARVARGSGAKVVAVVGRNTLTRAESASLGLDGVYAMTDVEPRGDVSMREAERVLRSTAERVADEWLPASATEI
jgi:glycerate kinase